MALFKTGGGCNPLSFTVSATAFYTVTIKILTTTMQFILWYNTFSQLSHCTRAYVGERAKGLPISAVDSVTYFSHIPLSYIWVSLRPKIRRDLWREPSAKSRWTLKIWAFSMWIYESVCLIQCLQEELKFMTESECVHHMHTCLDDDDDVCVWFVIV